MSNEKIRHKGKFLTKKQYERIERNSALGKSNQGRRVVEEKKSVLPPIEGCRLIDLQHLAKRMFCCGCKNPLLIQKIEKEKIEGLGSHWSIRCDKCSFLNNVTTGPKYSISGGEKRFIVNTKSALGK